MSLFVINRYDGEQQPEDNKNDKKHLSDLLKQIEERKRQRAAASEVVVEEPVKKKKKKRKEETGEEVKPDDGQQEVETNHNIVQEGEQEAVQQKKPKKKRKKTQDVDDSQVQNGIAESTEETAELGAESVIANGQTETPVEQNDFMVLGTNTKKKKKEVRRVLPDWLANPEIVPIDLCSGPTLEDLNSTLDSKLIEVLRGNGIEKLFPVQASMVTWMLKCSKDRQQGWWVRDTCVSAPTGSGKTLGYVLPVVQELQNRMVPKIRCLVVVPVQELAIQVHKVMLSYVSHTQLKVGLISGASSFEQEQKSIMKKTIRGEHMSTVDILVATPGRLVDHIMKTPGFSLGDLRFLVIDEADRAAEWMQYLPEPHYRAPPLTLQNLSNSKVPAQKLLFSATLSQDPEKLSRLGLFQPILFTSVVVSGKDGDVNLDKEVGDFIGRYTSPEELTELAVECSAAEKPLALYHLLTKNEDLPKTLVFTNSGETAHRLALLLRLFLSEKNASVSELSAQLMPKQRESVLARFAAGEIRVLVSSDALARGVDVPDVKLVVSYDLPKYIKGYIHRAGRTGRAGKLGTAVSVLTPNQAKLFKQMLSNAHKTVPEIEKLELASLASTTDYQVHVEKLKEILEEEKQEMLKKTKSAKRVKRNHA